LVWFGCLQVYLTLCVALASSAVGAYLHVVWNIGGMLTTLGCVGSIAWLFSVPVYEEVCSSLLRQLTLLGISQAVQAREREI